MPGSDDEFDLVHTFNQAQQGKSKTERPAPREIGRDGAPVQLYVGEERDETAVRTPPAGVVYTFINTNGNPRVIDSTGTVSSPVDGQAISPALVTTDEVSLGDDDQIILGANDDYAIVYDATDNRLEFRDQTNNTEAFLPRSGSGDILAGGFSGTTSAVSVSFDTWTTIDSNNPSLFLVEVFAQTDGSSNGKVDMDVDESGGTTSDYKLDLALADLDAGSGFGVASTTLVYLPAGAQVRVNNNSDPNNGNLLLVTRKAT